MDLGSRSEGSHHLCTKGATSARGCFSAGDTFSLPFLQMKGERCFLRPYSTNPQLNQGFTPMA